MIHKQNYVMRLLKLVHYLITVCLFSGCWKLSYAFVHADGPVFGNILTVVVLYGVVLMLLLRTYNAYQIGLPRLGVLVFSQSLSVLIAGGILYILAVIERMDLVDPRPLLGLLAIQFAMNCLWSIGANKIYFRIHTPKRTVLICGSEVDRKQIAEVCTQSNRFEVVQVICGLAEDAAEPIEQLRSCAAEVVFIAGIPATQRNEILECCIDRGIRAYVVPHVGDVILMGAKHVEMFSVPMVMTERVVPDPEYLLVKRGIDILFSLVGIVLSGPVMLAAALAVKLYDGGPVLYKQARLTKDGREFQILKFRSMRLDAEHDGVARLASEHDDRITPVGKVIRSCRLDELPQLVNILKGDMTIVGPRPERPEIAKQYETQMPAFSLRLQVRAGLTGFAQVYGRYNSTPCEKLQMDLMYLNKMSVIQDLKLMFATVKILFMKESASGIADGMITAAQSGGEK